MTEFELYSNHLFIPTIKDIEENIPTASLKDVEEEIVEFSKIERLVN